MDDNHRKLIIKNIDSLVNLTDFDKLCQACLVYNLLTDVMIHNIRHTDPGKIPPETCDELTIRKERHKRLFLKITKRGPEAFRKLRQIFKELKYREASKLLFDNDTYISITSSKQKKRPVLDDDEGDETADDQENIANNNIDDRDGTERRQLPRTFSNDNDITLHQYKDKIEPKKNVNVRKATKILKHPSIETYPMESEHHRGVFFMVNIVDFPSDPSRQGADVDTHALLSLFKQMNFKLYAYRNLTQKKFFELLDSLLESQEIKYTECFVMALMTHGKLVEGIQFVTFHDGSVVKVEEIEKRFYHENCPQLVHKPKILIFPYCRGDTSDKGVVIPNNKTQTESMSTSSRRTINNIVQLSDVIKCYATTAGFVAHRSVDDGSWYIQNFVDTIAEHAHDTPFEDMLKIVQSGIAKMRTERNEVQTASYDNIGFNKILYFNPGVFKI